MTRIMWTALTLLALCALGGITSLAMGDEPSGTVRRSIANVRAGPSTAYPIITQTTRGATYHITGRNQAGDWLQICCVKNKPGWMWAALLEVKNPRAVLPIVPAPPLPTPTPAPTPTPVPGWRGAYFANRDLAGTPAFVRDDPQISFRWDNASPGGNLPSSNFSVRWTRTVNLEAGPYQFFAQVDDGVRLYLDGWRVIDAWQDSPATTRTGTFEKVSAGNHTITVEYYQAAGTAVAIVWWQKLDQFPDWRGEYFNDIYLQGQPLLVRNDPAIDFNWGLGSPDPNVPADNWSVRWTHQVEFENGTYIFSARTADGVRIYLDGWLVLDEWHDTSQWTVYTGVFHNVAAGTHTVTVEYYARGGIAYAQVWWNKQ